MRTRAALCFGLILALSAVVVPSATAAERDQPPTAAVLLELDTEPAAPAWQRAASEARRAHRSPDAVRREAARAGAEQRARAVRALDRAAGSMRSTVPGARALYQMQTLLTGLAVRVPATELPGLTRLPGVRAVHPITLKDRSNAYSVPLTGAPEVWAGPNTGEGIRIGIIDSGIDYTHADFGGPGTEQAFRSVDRAKPAPAGLFPNEKVVGGKDLVGDDYNPDPASKHYQPVPHPSSNPIDCDLNGHGTHVAGTAAGYGVTSDGRTYRGPYRPGLDPSGFKVGPGAAPGAKLYAIRVFGCEGSTDQLAKALDVAADPHGNGDLTDRLDIVNLSLGDRFGTPDDADALAADRLAELGTVVVAAAGNDGDAYAIGGSPGTAARAIAVAASVHGHTDADGIRVLAPQADVVPGRWSSAYRGWSTEDVSGELALPVDQPDGCAAFSDADARRLRGRIAVLSWHTKDADRACGSAPRTDHAADAGAIGVLLAADSDNLAEIAGNDRIPATLIAREDGARLTKAMDKGPVRVQLAAPGDPLHGAVAQDQPQRADTLTSFTSRGIGVAGVVKPDLAAPGESVWSAKAGSGSGGMRDNGTSMATPHIAGLAALVRSAHPDWTPEEVKAALMNTAGDTWLGDNHSGPVYGPERTGAGRVQVDRAVRTPAVAYEVDVPGAVGVSFGPVAVTRGAVLSREVELRNFSDAALSYATGYLSATELPGASFELSPSKVNVPAGGTARVTVTLRASAEVGRTPDPTIDTVQAGHPRSYRGELSGQLLLTPSTEDPPLRVPLFAAPRAASDLQAGPLIRGGTALPLIGTGSGLVSVLALGGEAPRWPDCPSDGSCADTPADRAANLRAVGAGSDGDLLYFAAALWAPASTPVAPSAVRVSLDTDGDGTTDAVIVADRLPGSDVLVARTLDARTGKELDVQPLNAHWGDTDTDLLDSDTLLLPVRRSALPHPTAIRYAVWTGVPTTATPDPAHALSAIGLTDSHPTLQLPDFPATMTAPEHPGTTLQLPAGPPRLLLIHHLNPDAHRAEIINRDGTH